jgi:hypothetical protein
MSRVQVDPFVFLFERELKKLENEINLYSDEADLWRLQGAIANTAGNLCLHLCGNLQHYIGAMLGKTEYVRNRAEEFNAKNISKAKLIAEVVKTRQAVLLTLEKLDDQVLQLTYPEQVLGYPMTTIFFLNHLYGHFGYHLGQINYHRRIISSQTSLK